MVVGQGRRAGVGERPGGIETDEIGRGRLVERHDPAMRAGDQEGEHAELEREQQRGADGKAPAVEPGAVGPGAGARLRSVSGGGRRHWLVWSFWVRVAVVILSEPMHRISAERRAAATGSPRRG